MRQPTNQELLEDLLAQVEIDMHEGCTEQSDKTAELVRLVRQRMVEPMCED